MERSVKLASQEVVALGVSLLLVGILIKLPLILGLDPKDDIFYLKNLAPIALGGLSLYLMMSAKPVKHSHWLIPAAIFLLSAVYVNLLPSNPENKVVLLVCLHLPLLLWGVCGWVYMQFDTRSLGKRVEFLKYNGDLAILSALILMAGGVLAGATISLFSLIQLHIEPFIAQYVVLWGLVSVAIVSTFIIRNFQINLNPIARLIALLFSPLTLLTLVAFLIGMATEGNNPYQDRNFLLVFNLMLFGIMILIAFSVSESSSSLQQRFIIWILFLLVLVAICIDLLALSAILYRVNAFGLSENRCAVFGSNLLIAGNLIIILIRLYAALRRKAELKQVENDIARYLPVYLAWVAFVVFCFPLIFGI